MAMHPSTMDADGFTIINNLRDREVMSTVRAGLTPMLQQTAFGTNTFVGTRTKRIHSVFGRTRVLDDLATDPTVMAVVSDRVGDVLLSATVACEVHPGETLQAPHTDDGIYPLPPDHRDVSLSALWALDDFTASNGGTIVFPGSQGDRLTRPDHADARPVEMEAGSVLLYSGTLWHGGGANTTDAPRLGLILTYTESWLRPQDSHLITVPIEMARGLTPELRALLGYSMRPPFLGYVDGNDPADLFNDPEVRNQ
jgi:ectoine hydroxylase-related dioxygenase (phytanoyl-CoA dioxygenase family)